MVIRVFVAADGSGGNQLGVVMDAAGVAAQDRQATAARLGYSETIFVEDGGRLAIYTPAEELPFAGHPLVGAAWLLGLDELHPPAGTVAAGRDGEWAWIIADGRAAPDWELIEHAEAAEVDALTPPLAGHAMHWAWLEESRVRARVFAPDLGIPEDPATGSAALRLCNRLGRELTIVQGSPASELFVAPLGEGMMRLSGRVSDKSAALKP